MLDILNGSYKGSPQVSGGQSSRRDTLNTYYLLTYQLLMPNNLPLTLVPQDNIHYIIVSWVKNLSLA